MRGDFFMTGKSHKTIGVATGIAFTLYSVSTGNPIYAMAMVTAPIGAMLPDIDHDNSKIGNSRKNVTSIASILIKIGILLALVMVMVLGYLKDEFILTLIKVSIVLGPLFICILIANNPKVKSKTKFFTKHRGIMHTLVVPICCILGGFFCSLEAIRVLSFGLAAGYFSHLLADCCTKRGCPILWPLTSKSLRVLKITTGTFWEYLMCLLLSGGIVWIGIWLGH